MADDFDLFVIGGGSGGIAAARRAAHYGARVGLAEARQLGGTCVNRGCVPKKLMVYASHFSQQFEAAEGYGWSSSPRHFHWPALVTALDQEVNRLNHVYRESLDDAGVQVFYDHAQFVDPHTLLVGDATVTAAKVVIAVGGHPRLPNNIPGIEHAITSDDIFHFPQQPKRMVIIGGSYVGSEFACIMHGLGTEITQVILAKTILRGFDDDLRQEIHGAMERRGIKIIAKSEQIAIAKADQGLEVTVTTASGQVTIATDGVSLAATGRSPNLNNLGLEHTGVEVKDGAIAVDPHHRTTVPHIFALGDAIDRVNLTPVAIKAGRLVADTAFGQATHPMSYDTIPTAVFTTPEIGTVGLTEADAVEKFGAADVTTYCSRFRPLYYAPINLTSKTLMKLVVQRSTERVLGAHMVGDYAAEIIQGVAIAVQMGATKADFDATVGIHPTSAEEFVSL